MKNVPKKRRGTCNIHFTFNTLFCNSYKFEDEKEQRGLTMAVVWDAAPCSTIEVYRHFGGPSCQPYTCTSSRKLQSVLTNGDFLCYFTIVKHLE
jgi:hypothetical protein